MKQFLTTAIVGAAVYLGPCVAVRQRNRYQHLERELGEISLPEGVDILLTSESFHEEVATDFADEVDEWRKSPKAHGGKGSGSGSGSEWAWKSGFDPCKGSKKSKGTKKGGSGCDGAEDGSGGPPDGPDNGGGDGSIPDNGAGDGTIPDNGAGDGTIPDNGAGDGTPTAFPTTLAPTVAPVVDGFENSTCSAIENEVKPEMGEGDTQTTYTATISLEYQRPPLLREGVVFVFQEASTVLDLWVSGCEDRAKELAAELRGDVEVRRRLQEAGISWVNSVYAPSGADPCTTLETEQTCSDKFTADFEIISSDVPSEDLLNRVLEAFTVFAGLINDLGGGYLNFDPSNVIVSDGTEDQGAVGDSDLLVEQGSASVPMVIGAVAGGLAFVLLLVLLARKGNQSDDQVSHLKLEEDGEDTLLREYASTGSYPSQEGNYESRNVHVVGETDSLYSGWTGYTKNGRSGEDADGYNGDVHKCSSATCEVCEQRRQQGVQFIPTTIPMRMQLPYDTEREYIADDTVQL